MKLILAIIGLAVCIGFRSVESVPTPGKLFAYPWTEWLKLKVPAPVAAALSPPTTAPSADPSESSESLSEDDLINYLKRSILPAPKKKDKVVEALTGETTTPKPKLIEVGDFWAPPTDATTNLTSAVVIDPAFWAAKKTMFISRLFAALAKQVLNSTGTVTTTTETPNAALLKEIDTVLLSDVARSIVDADEEAAPVNPFAALFGKGAKAKKKAAKKVKPTKTPTPVSPSGLSTPTKKPTPVSQSGLSTPKPTLDYSLLAKALLS